jgi:hypothetical protein
VKCFTQRQPWTADVEAGFGDRLGGLLVAFEGERATEHGHGQAAFLEGAHEAPEARPAAELEHALAGEIPAFMPTADEVDSVRPVSLKPSPSWTEGSEPSS